MDIKCNIKNSTSQTKWRWRSAHVILDSEKCFSIGFPKKAWLIFFLRCSFEYLWWSLCMVNRKIVKQERRSNKMRKKTITISMWIGIFPLEISYQRENEFRVCIVCLTWLQTYSSQANSSQKISWSIKNDRVTMLRLRKTKLTHTCMYCELVCVFCHSLGISVVKFYGIKWDGIVCRSSINRNPFQSNWAMESNVMVIVFN